MNQKLRNRLRRHRPALESLEGRAVPATFGVPWQDAANLSLSFAPDGTPIANHTSSLFQTLDSREPSADWQRAILQAFQTWAVDANINIGLTTDSGDPFGTSGASQHDPRFGDIRVGAQPMAPDALSISVPNDPTLSSTWTGDVLINSNDQFGPGKLDVLSVLMHEAGHVFGLDDSDDPNSPMDAQYSGAQTLTAQDFQNLQGLYGVRAPDSHEGSSGNNTMGKASQVSFPSSYNGVTPLVVYGDVGSQTDVDFYALRPPSNYHGPLTVRLQSQGISLLTPHLTVLDPKGHVLGDAQASSDRGDVVTVHLDQTDPNATYYLEVRGATSDVFGIGSYGLAATFDATNTATADALDSVLRGPYQSLTPDDISLLFTDPDQILVDNGHHDGSGVQLVPSPGYASNTHYQAVGSIASSSDVDLYRVQQPGTQNGQALVLTATVRALSPNGTVPRITLLDSDQNPIPSRVLANGDGTFTVQATGLNSGGNNFLEITPNESNPASLGNYTLDVTYGPTAANLATFAEGSLDPAASSESFDFYVGESQLMQFVLAAGAGAAAGTAVQMTITDSNGVVVDTLTAMVGDTVSGPASFLTPGAYTLRFTLLGDPGAGAPPTSYSLLGEGISDPIGPVTEDPTLTPVYTSPTTPGIFTYPTGTTTTATFLIVPKMT